MLFLVQGDKKYILFEPYAVNHKNILELIQENNYLDFYEIPKYLNELVPTYKFKMRHHGKGNLYDTVLYAWVPESD